jgi:hypothetical protein
MQRLLFICSANRLRSPTAEQVFSQYPDVEASSAGLNQDAEEPLTPEHFEGIDIVFVMDKGHRNKVTKIPAASEVSTPYLPEHTRRVRVHAAGAGFAPESPRDTTPPITRPSQQSGTPRLGVLMLAAIISDMTDADSCDRRHTTPV